MVKKYYKITKEKITWLLLILLVLSSSLFILFFTDSNTNRSNVFDPTPLRVADMYIKLGCRANNTEFITEDSSIRCEVSAITEYQRSYDNLNVIIQAYELNNLSLVIWGCNAQLFNVSNVSYTNSILCENSAFDDVFKPERNGVFKFRLSSVDGRADNGVYLEYAGQDLRFFKKDLNVLSKNEALAIGLSDNNYKIAILAILLFVPTLLLELRRFLRE